MLARKPYIITLKRMPAGLMTGVPKYHKYKRFEVVVVSAIAQA